MAIEFMVHKPEDTVAVALRDLEATGRELAGILLHGGSRLCLTLREPVPAGHKIALRDMGEKTPVFRNGMDIGVLTAPVRQGERVHDHNLTSRRWRA